MARTKTTDLDPDVRLLSALADPTRLAIVRQLAAETETCACDFTSCCDVGQPTVSHHLRSCARRASSTPSGAGSGSSTASRRAWRSGSAAIARDARARRAHDRSRAGRDARPGPPRRYAGLACDRPSASGFRRSGGTSQRSVAAARLERPLRIDPRERALAHRDAAGRRSSFTTSSLKSGS